ncbi:5858_t:CDS:2, partial [Ambispora leptoticha]
MTYAARNNNCLSFNSYKKNVALKRRISYVEHELERLKKSRNDNAHIGTRILEDPETLNEEAVFDGIPWMEIPSFTIKMPPGDDERSQLNIVRKDGYLLWTESVTVIEGKGNIQNTTSHKDAMSQVCDRHMEILKQQRLRNFVFGIVLDCRCVEIIQFEVARRHFYITELDAFHYLLLMEHQDGQNVRIDKAIILKEGYDLLHHEQEILSRLTHPRIIKLHGVNLVMSIGASYALPLYPR